MSSLVSLVHGVSMKSRAARALISGGRASSLPPSTLSPEPVVRAHPAQATALSPSRVFVRPGEGSLSYAPVDHHHVGSDWHTTSCLCLCHYGEPSCDALPGARYAYASCESSRR